MRISDWSSDVCSSDLDTPDGAASPVSEGSGDESDPRGGGEGDHGTPAAGSDCEEEGEGLRPLPDRIVSDLTAWRTLALQDAFAQAPAIAFAAVLHALVLGCFYAGTRASCVQVAANRVYFINEIGRAHVRTQVTNAHLV